MSSADLALKMFAEQLRPWKPIDLEKAVKSNMSIATELKLSRANDLQRWRILVSTNRLLDRRGHAQLIQSINYNNVLTEIRKVNPELGRAVEVIPGANAWLFHQIDEVKQLIFF